MENSTAFSRGSALVGSRAGADELCINAIRVLAIDAVQRANSGHPGEAHAQARRRRHPQPGRVNACWELFDRQPESYRNTVLPPTIRARVGIEAAAPFGWERYVGLEGAIIGVTEFGSSAPGPVVMREFGFTPEHVVETAKRVLKS